MIREGSIQHKTIKLKFKQTRVEDINFNNTQSFLYSYFLLHVLQHANTLTSSNQGMMQSLWKQCSQYRRRTVSSTVKSSIHTEHCSPLSEK